MPDSSTISLVVNGQHVSVDDGSGATGHNRGVSLLDVLRSQLGLLSVKDGCSPQGQCGCCTVLVDGQPRVACVTPVRRVRGREVTTLEGLDDADRWADAFCAAGASQCGFCTPGIIMRLAGADLGSPSRGGLDAHSPVDGTGAAVDEAVGQALLAHLCRCTGWQTIGEACALMAGASPVEPAGRGLEAAGRRATIEGGAPQTVDPTVALGRGGFAADTAPDDALVAVLGADGTWVVGADVVEARALSGKVQGRRTTVAPSWPLEIPDGEWGATLRTTWVDPAYLETDASWSEPGGTPYSTVANGGAFGAKLEPGPEPAPASRGGAGGGSPLDVASAARALADEHGRPVLALASREDVARLGVKRPPLAAGINDQQAVFRVAETPGIAEVIESTLRGAGYDGGITVEQIPLPGPPTSAAVRAAGWAETLTLLAGFRGEAGPIRSPSGAEATAEVDLDGNHIRVSVRCGPILDPVVLRSYCIGAAHMAWSWLTSESLAVGDDGSVHDLTVRSFGVLRAVDSPTVTVDLIEGYGEPVNGSDAVFAAVAAAGWLARSCPPDWPVGR